MSNTFYELNPIGPFDKNGEIIDGGTGPMKGTINRSLLCPKCHSQEFFNVIELSCAQCNHDMTDVDIRTSELRINKL